MMRRCMGTLLLCGGLAGCATPAIHPSLRTAALPDLLPAASFISRAPAAPVISPDGKRLLRLQKGHILVSDAALRETHRIEAEPETVAWAGDSRHVVWDQDSGGETRLLILDTDAPDAAPVTLTAWPGASSRLLHAGDRRLLFLSTRRGQSGADLWSYDFRSRRLEMLQKNPGDVADYVLDTDQHVGARVRHQDDRRILQVADERGQWKSAYSWSQFDAVRPLRIDRASGRLLLLSNVGRDKTALVERSLRDGSERLLFLHPQVDPHRVVLDPDGAPVAVWYEPDLPRTLVLDERLHAGLAQAMPADVKAWRLLDVDRGSTRAVVRAWSASGDFDALFERATGELAMLDDRRRKPALDALTVTRPVRFAGSDGRPIPAYLTLPRDAGRPLPLLVWLHDGPWERAWWSPTDTHALPQFHANRGYAVLEVNYRGSAGFGRMHMEAARGEIGGRVLQDIADGVEWAVARGIADPAHVAVGGSGFGAYAAMQAASREPARYACVVAERAIADLGAAIENPPPAWRESLHLWLSYAGDPASPEERARLTEISPLYGAGRIRVPLLVVQGAHDVQTTQEHAQRMVQALRSQGKPVHYVLFADDGHPLRRPENRVAAHRATEDFLAQCLGGRSSGWVTRTAGP